MVQQKKFTYMTFSINKDEQIENVIEILQDFKDKPKFYAYIFHDKDKDENGDLKKKHMHVFVRSYPLTLSAWANKFDLPENMLEIPKSISACARYLIHADQPQKYQYSIDQVVSSDIDEYKNKYFAEKISLEQKFEDFLLLRKGRMTPREFLEKYRNELANTSFIQQLKGFDYITKNYNQDLRRVI